MTNAKKMVLEVKEEEAPALHVLAAVNGAAKKTRLSAPLVVPSRNYTRPPRPELAALGWSNRAIRLAGRK
ncbi:MAG TPA: hypothetical protein VK731_03605 [Candidatus Cybelea sp.]|jgi:hypothetical protein|nr:hypothetical protein [Candidatus Cybelea sp.]